MRRKFLDLEEKLWKPGFYWSKEKNTMITQGKLPLEERYTGRFIKLETLLSDLPSKENNLCEIDKFFDISSWENYCYFLRFKR